MLTYGLLALLLLVAAGITYYGVTRWRAARRGEEGY